MYLFLFQLLMWCLSAMQQTTHRVQSHVDGGRLRVPMGVGERSKKARAFENKISRNKKSAKIKKKYL